MSRRSRSCVQHFSAKLLSGNSSDFMSLAMHALRRLVEGHGGRLEVLVDRRRKGANLRLVLPRKRSRATFSNGR
jgi:hypothetical protein